MTKPGARLRPLPPSAATGRRCLDLGCGSATPPGIGIDIDPAALRANPSKRVAVARAEALPFAAATFDTVTASVSLPYTNIPRALREARRVLTEDGVFWAVLHPWRMVTRGHRGEWLFILYVCANSLLFALIGRMVPWVRGNYESFQTGAGMRCALRRAGFGQVRFSWEYRHFVVRARAASNARHGDSVEAKAITDARERSPLAAA